MTMSYTIFSPIQWFMHTSSRNEWMKKSFICRFDLWGPAPSNSRKRHRLYRRKDKNEINPNKDISVFKKSKYRSCMKAFRDATVTVNHRSTGHRCTGHRCHRTTGATVPSYHRSTGAPYHRCTGPPVPPYHHTTGPPVHRSTGLRSDGGTGVNMQLYRYTFFKV
jgi:hypothetical protein